MDGKMNRRQLIFGSLAASALACVPAISVAESSRELEMYEVGGQTVFPIYNTSGAISQEITTFPFYRDGKNLIVFGYRNTMAWKVSAGDSYTASIHQDAKALFNAAIRRGDAVTDIKDGGPLPEHGKIVRITGLGS